MNYKSARVLTTIACISSLACTQRAPVPTRVESPGLGIAIAALPAPFEVQTNSGETLELSAPGSGVVSVANGPIEISGINLIAAVQSRKAAFDEAPSGQYLGNRELGTPLGTAFSARGRRTDESGRFVEETWIYAIHPQANRLFTLTYTYPAGEDSGERVEQLMALLGEIEGLSE